MSSPRSQNRSLDTRIFLRSSVREKQQILAQFIHNMTVSLRDAYFIDSAAATEKFKKWNELLHRIAGSLRDMATEAAEHLPDEVLMEMIASTAGEGLKQEIVWAWTRSVEWFEKNKQRKKAPVH